MLAAVSTFVCKYAYTPMYFDACISSSSSKLKFYFIKVLRKAFRLLVTDMSLPGRTETIMAMATIKSLGAVQAYDGPLKELTFLLRRL